MSTLREDDVLGGAQEGGENPSAAREAESEDNIQKRWRKLAGEGHWAGMLDRLDLDLRKQILFYGDMAEVTYETFNIEPMSPNVGTSRFDRASLFRECGLEPKEKGPFPYTATKYIYATAGNTQVPGAFIIPGGPTMKQSNWMGYMAVTTDQGTSKFARRDVVIAWRGTIQALEWANDDDYMPVPATKLVAPGRPAPNIHHGFLSIYTTANPASQFNKTSARDQVFAELRRLVDQYKNQPMSVTVVGHSLGAAITTVCTWDIAQSGILGPAGNCPVTGYAFASPRVGDSSFQRAFNAVPNARLLRITNRPDVVPQYPPTYAGFSDIGEVLTIDTRQSPYLAQPGNIGTYHDLECYLHGVAGTHGTHGGFKLVVNRDPALTNKLVDALQPQSGVPPYWWVIKDRGMMQQPDGHWKLSDYQADPAAGPMPGPMPPMPGPMPGPMPPTPGPMPPRPGPMPGPMPPTPGPMPGPMPPMPGPMPPMPGPPFQHDPSSE